MAPSQSVAVTSIFRPGVESTQPQRVAEVAGRKGWRAAGEPLFINRKSFEKQRCVE